MRLLVLLYHLVTMTVVDRCFQIACPSCSNFPYSILCSHLEVFRLQFSNHFTACKPVISVLAIPLAVFRAFSLVMGSEWNCILAEVVMGLMSRTQSLQSNAHYHGACRAIIRRIAKMSLYTPGLSYSSFHFSVVNIGVDAHCGTTRASSTFTYVCADYRRRSQCVMRCS